MWRTGGWQDHLLNVERHNSAGCFFKLLDKPSGNSYSFLKINMDHIPHQKAALGSPEVYSPGILRCFGFSGEDMVLWESSVYGNQVFMGRGWLSPGKARNQQRNLHIFAPSIVPVSAMAFKPLRRTSFGSQLFFTTAMPFNKL